jgi:hypothetical protein
MEVLIADCGNIRNMATKNKAAKLKEEDDEEKGSRRIKHEGKKDCSVAMYTAVTCLTPRLS